VVINAGNDDYASVHERLESSGFALHGEGRVVDLDSQHAMISCGYANMTPWRCPGDLPEGELAERIGSMVNRLGDPSTAVFNLHCPPHNTPLDLAPRLGEDLTPVLAPGGEVEMAHVGSTAVREALEKYQPLLGLHGHIHESRGFTKVGRTLAINPGSSYGEGRLQGVLVDLTPKGIGSYLMTSG
jgi:Icc-related predicted phosphoesterase